MLINEPYCLIICVLFYLLIRWTIDTKYYSADISIWTADLNDDFLFDKLPISKQLAGLVMVFDMSDVCPRPYYSFRSVDFFSFGWW